MAKKLRIGNFIAPNPNALTFTGAVEATYDGSEAVNVEIPEGIEKVSAWQLVWKHTATAEDAELSSFEITSAEYPEIANAKWFFLDVTHANSVENIYRRFKLNGIEICRIQDANKGHVQFAHITPSGVVLAFAKTSITLGGRGGMPTLGGVYHSVDTAPATPINTPITSVRYDSYTKGVLVEGSTVRLWICK